MRLRSGDRIALGQSSVTLLFLDGPVLEEANTTRHDLGYRRARTPGACFSQVGGSDLEKLSLFLEAAQRFNGTQVLEDVLSTMIEYALRLTCAERGFVFLGDNVASLRLRTGRASNGSVLQDDSKISRSIVRDAAHSGLDYILGDATGEGAAIGRDSIIAHDLRSVIAIPLRRRSNGTLLGLLYLDSRLQSCNLSTVSREILRAIATEAATLVENARMLEAEQAAALLRKEMEIAAAIRQRIISSDLPDVPGYALSARTLPCTEVGGDFYDVVRTEDGCVAIVADVSGKGMSAALLASIVHGMMYAQIASGASLVDAVSAVHALPLRPRFRGEVCHPCRPSLPSRWFSGTCEWRTRSPAACRARWSRPGDRRRRYAGRHTSHCNISCCSHNDASGQSHGAVERRCQRGRKPFRRRVYGLSL